MSEQAIHYELRDGVACLGIENPPLNALNRDVRVALMARLEAARDDDQVRAVLIYGRGSSFPAGLDAKEFDHPELPALRDLCRAVSAMPKPVVAAIHGSAIGGGCELALACHYRLAHPGARVGLPEVSLGLVPSGGATQRLPRLIAPAGAMDLLLSGQPVSVRDDRVAGLFDQITGENMLQEALAYTLDLLARGQGPRPTDAQMVGAMDPMAYQGEILARRDAFKGHVERAPVRIIDAAEAAQLLPFEAGLALEAELAEEARTDDQARALRHVYFAERRMPIFPEHTRGKLSEIGSIGVIGAGPLSVGLAVIALDAGLSVVLHGKDEATAHALVGQVGQIYDRATERGRLPAATRDDRMARLTPTDTLNGLAGLDMVVETTVADDASRGVLLDRLGQHLPATSILVTTGPCAGLDDIAEASGRAGRVLGLRFMSPAHVMRLVEVVVGGHTLPDAVVSVVGLLRKLSRVPMRSAPRNRPLGAEMQLNLQRMVLALADGGVHPYQIDAALRDFGMSAGPFQAIDFDGLTRVRTRLSEVGQVRSPILDALIEAGRDGRASGAGFLKYADGGTGQPDDDLTEMLPGLRPELRMHDSEIVEMCIAAMANCGARLVREKQVSRPSDLDVALIFGFGYPRLKGGPMQAADADGLFTVQRRLQRFAEAAGPDWDPDPLILDLVKNGRKFGDMNG